MSSRYMDTVLRKEQSATEAYAVTRSRRLEGIRMLDLLLRSSQQRIMPIFEQVDFEN